MYDMRPHKYHDFQEEKCFMPLFDLHHDSASKFANFNFSWKMFIDLQPSLLFISDVMNLREFLIL